jgi:spore coat protein CotH
MKHLRTTGIVALILTALLAPALAGCAYAGLTAATPDDGAPFYQDRVSTVRILMGEEDWAFCMEHPFAEQYVQADFWFNDELVPDVGVRTKGNSSLSQAAAWDSPRLPLCVDFNLFNKARAFHGLKKVFLNNGWSDPTLVREVVTYKLFEEFGLPASRATLVDLWVNDIHLGVYTMVEMVDQTFINNHFQDGSGHLYKPELVSARLDWTEEEAYKPLTIMGAVRQPTEEENPELQVNIGGAPLIDILEALGKEDLVGVTPTPVPEGDARGMPPVDWPANRLEAMMLKTNEDSPDVPALLHFLDVLNNTPDETFPGEIEKVLDVDMTLKFIAASAVTVHLDNYIGAGHNTYFYEANGVFRPIVWDTNMVFGTFNSGIPKEGLINFYIDEPTSGPSARYPLVKRLLDYQPFLDKYNGYVQEFLDGPLDLETLLPRIDAWHDLVAPYARADTEMFYSYEDFERCYTEDLRPPGAFEGWMAGGPSPTLPFLLSPSETTCLKQKFQVRNLFELLGHQFKSGELEILKECLTEKHFNTFLQNLYGPLKAPQPPRQPGFGPNSLGLKTFIIARYHSVQAQLDGELPSSSGTGRGNGASMWMSDMFGR